MVTEPFQPTGHVRPEQLYEVLQRSAVYDVDDDAVAARNLIVAGRALLQRGVTSIDHAGDRLTIQPATLEKQVAEAEKFLADRRLDTCKPTFYRPPRHPTR